LERARWISRLAKRIERQELTVEEVEEIAERARGEDN